MCVSRQEGLENLTLTWHVANKRKTENNLLDEIVKVIGRRGTRRYNNHWEKPTKDRK